MKEVLVVRLEAWTRKQGKESTFLSVEYAFKKFDQAIKFVGDVGAIANDEDVRISLSHHTSFPTHLGGLCYYLHATLAPPINYNDHIRQENHKSIPRHADAYC